MKTGRTVVITSAAGGIGALVAKRFLENGDVVVATDAREDSLKQLVERLGPSERLFPGKLSGRSADTVAEGYGEQLVPSKR